MKVYLAGPEVFLANAIEIGLLKKDLCRKYGFIGLFPFDNEVNKTDKNQRIDHIIYNANVAMMKIADFAIVNLTPFRGPSADVGSVFELGLMAGMGKEVFGYTNVVGSLVSRMEKSNLVDYEIKSGLPIDKMGMFIENFDNSDNLMIDSCLAIQGNPLVSVDSMRKNIFCDLTAFELCLEMAHKKLMLKSPLFI